MSHISVDSFYMPIVPWGKVTSLCFKFEREHERRDVFPLIQINAPQVDPLTLDAQYPLDEYLGLMANSICASFSKEQAFVVDRCFSAIDEIGGKNAYVFLMDLLWQQGRRAIPVVSNLFSHNENSKYIDRLDGGLTGRFVIKYVFQNHGNDVENLKNWFSETLKLINVDSESIDVVLDLGYVGGWTHSNAIDGIEEWIKSVNAIANWKTIFITGTSIPSGFCAQNSLGFPVIRNEWGLFKDLRRRLSHVTTIHFSDSAIFGTSLSCVVNMNQTCMVLPYTSDDSFYVFTKLKIRDDPAGSFRAAFHELMTYPGVFKGKDYSFGDALLQQLYDSDDPQFDNSVSTYVMAALLDHHIRLNLNLI